MEKSRFSVAGRLSLGALALAMASSAHAADDNAAKPADTSEIIVTAFKKSESALKVPAVINVISGSDLKTVGVNTVTDLQNVVPGVNIGAGSFGINVAIRGVTSTDETSKGELGIAFNIDGAFIGRGQEEGVAFFDLARVEVLKGPQGTLYGRSSTGGAINVITQKPIIGDLSGYAKIEFGNYNTRRAEAALNIPVSDILAFRVAGNFNDRDGYLKPVDTTVTGATGTNALSATGEPAKNDQHDRTGRFSALLKPSDAVTATVVVTVGHIGGVGSGSALDDNLQQGGSAQFNVVPDPVPSWIDENFVNVNEQLNWKMGSIQLDLLGNEQHFSAHNQVTGNNNPYDTGSTTAAGSFALDNYAGSFNTNQFEARFSNVNPGMLDYVFGANYYHEEIRESDHDWTAPVDTWQDTSTWVTSIDPVDLTKHVSYGFFGQVTLHASDKLSFIGGARYTHDQASRVGTFAVGTSPSVCSYPNDCTSDPTGGTVAQEVGNQSDHKITWKVGANYQITPRDMVYASVATGFKAGGFNDFDPSTGTTAAYRPESLTAYEIGYKGKPLPGLSFGSSLYYYDYSADQINSLTLFLEKSGVVGVLYTQVVPVEIYGWENELHYQVDHATTLNASLALEHSRIVNMQTGYLGYLTGVFANFHDYRLPNTPGAVATLSGTHAFALGNDRELRLRVATKISSPYDLTDFANAVVLRQPAYTRSDASLTFATAGDKLTVQLFVENIENKLQRTAGPNGYNGTYATGYNPGPETDGTGYPTHSLNYGVSTPRFFGVRLGTKF
jgi:iron complex outermembrane recepter protein